MDIEQAYRIVKQYGEYIGLSNLLMILDDMNADYNNLDSQERRAYKLVAAELAEGVVA